MAFAVSPTVGGMRIDLHTHSTCSDGTQSPAELVAAAARADIDVLALTDHDTTRGWAPAQAAAERHGLRLVPGIEVSTVRDAVSYHLLGYGPAPAHPGLAAELDRARTSRAGRAREIVRRLARDYPVTWQDVAGQVPDGATIGRPHIADALVRLGCFPHRDDVFAKVLYTGSPYYATYYAPDPARAVELVRAAGGVPVLAHPRAARQRNHFDADLLAELVGAGLAGVEVDHPEHDAGHRRELRALAAGHDLIVTGASDHHGAGKRTGLGQELTEPGEWARLAERLTR